MRLPTLCILRTRYPDLAGVLLRDWACEGLLTSYRYHRTTGFVLVALRPRWRWLLQLICWIRLDGTLSLGLRRLACLFFSPPWRLVRHWVRREGSARWLWDCPRCGVLRLTRTASPPRGAH